MSQIQCPNCGGFRVDDKASKVTGCLGSMALVVAIYLGVKAHWIVGVVFFIVVFILLVMKGSASYMCRSCGYKWSEKNIT